MRRRSASVGIAGVAGWPESAHQRRAQPRQAYSSTRSWWSCSAASAPLGTLIGGMSLGILNTLLEPYAGAVLAKILVLVGLILFIQRRPRGLFPQTGRAAESTS